MINLEKEAALKSLDPAAMKKLSIILVPDTRDALIALATAWRAQFSVPVIGITGSIGKTSTKEMLANILRLQGMNILVSQGNQNTALGLSMNILQMNAEHEVAIFEMGVSKRGEMGRMAALVKPTTAIITAIGHSHMEGLGSLADIASEKREIFKYFKENNIGIINGDLPILANIAYNHPMLNLVAKQPIRSRHVKSNRITRILILF